MATPVTQTDEQRRQIIARSRAEAERQAKGKKIVFVQPSKKVRSTGVRIIDPETGRVGSSRFPSEFGENVFLFSVEAPSILASRRRSEEKGEELELAAKRAGLERIEGESKTKLRTRVIVLRILS